MSDCQVLIVGAGPTGLVLAAELLARGVTTRIIDKGDGVVLQARAVAVHARTLEVLDSMSLADRFIEHGQVVRKFRFYSDGSPVLTLDLARNGSRYGFMLDIAQDDTERLLRARVSELGGTVEQGLELVSLASEPDRVTATVCDRAGSVGQITADFLVGCDGAHSRVRHALGAEFTGHPYPQDWLLADVALDWDRPENTVHAFFRADPAPLICFPLTGHRWRVTVPFAGQRESGPPTLADIQELVDERAPEPLAVSDPTWLANFRCHRRSANMYRRGRVLLAGDAVHIHTPAGGQGMNTGITDAHNLAWKLALVASGRSPEWLLDSYGQERQPVAAGVLGLTHALVRLGTLSNPVKRTLRDAIVPAVATIPPIQQRAVRRWSQVHVAYSASPLTQPGRHRGAPKPGERARDIEVLGSDGPTRLHAVLRTGRHVLLVPTARQNGPVPAVPIARDQVEIVTGSFGRACEPAWLIRPDGYIAACGQLSDLGPIRTYLLAVFGPGCSYAQNSLAGSPAHGCGKDGSLGSGTISSFVCAG